jgi:hypothetical protein
MNAYETTSTVEDQGQVRVAGVPFAPGTEVAVTISPKHPRDQELTPPIDVTSGTGLRWAGNVLVHQGVGAAPSLAETRDERLNHLSGARSA